MCGGRVGGGRAGMECVRNSEPERSRVNITANSLQIHACFIERHVAL